MAAVVVQTPLSAYPFLASQEGGRVQPLAFFILVLLFFLVWFLALRSKGAHRRVPLAHLLTTSLVFILRGAATGRAQPASLVIRILPGGICGRSAPEPHRLIPIVVAFASLFLDETMRRVSSWATSRPRGLELGMGMEEAFEGRGGFEGAAKVEGAESGAGEGEGR